MYERVRLARMGFGLFFLSKRFSAALIAISSLGAVKRPKSRAGVEGIGERVERDPRTRQRPGKGGETVVQKISKHDVNEFIKKICRFRGKSTDPRFLLVARRRRRGSRRGREEADASTTLVCSRNKRRRSVRVCTRTLEMGRAHINI